MLRETWRVAVLVGLLVMVGCRSEPETRRAASPATAPAPEVQVPAASAPPEMPAPAAQPQADTLWQWPITPAQLATLKAMKRDERIAVLHSLIPPTYQLHRVRGQITIDGVLDEADWQSAPPITLREGTLGTTTWYQSTAKMLWDDQYLYIGWTVSDPNIVSTFAKHDEPLWEQDVLEVFIDANSDEKGYVELHTSPANVHFDAIFADFRPETDWFADPTWKRFKDDTMVQAYDAVGVKSAVKVDGTPNKSDDTDKGYTVEWAIPFVALREAKPYEQPAGAVDLNQAPQVPVDLPKPGTVWRMNLVQCNPSAPPLLEGEYPMWVPTTGTSHMPYIFGRVQFMAN